MILLNSSTAIYWHQRSASHDPAHRNVHSRRASEPNTCNSNVASRRYIPVVGKPFGHTFVAHELMNDYVLVRIQYLIFDFDCAIIVAHYTPADPEVVIVKMLVHSVANQFLISASTIDSGYNKGLCSIVRVNVGS